MRREQSMEKEKGKMSKRKLLNTEIRIWCSWSSKVENEGGKIYISISHRLDLSIFFLSFLFYLFTASFFIYVPIKMSSF